ncbi:L-lactate permease [Aliidiomarina halalkaliphila]|uniref:L-lactate permease n=1 Tax=Aliidiomarina halalkaliphila TaxID=2593535 RepID=A0A552X1A7_9GAMM|nr:L-lactate permease [Aliidiomarina halalkaliphila]TRW48755.1 L-lactate permease [Aliidiomarina halalkaliphila]
MVLLALCLPFLVILVGMIGLRWSALKAGFLALCASLLVLPLLLGISLDHVISKIMPGSILESATTSISILWIILGALCIFYLQQASGALQTIQALLTRLHPNPRVSGLFVAWFFSLFMEGAAGFGTSAALAAPFLVAAGYRPVMAVVLALWGHSLGVMFGAVGTPVITQSALVQQSEIVLAQSALPFAWPGGIVLAIALAWFCFHHYHGEPEAQTQHKGIMSVLSIGAIGAFAALSFLLPFSVLAWWTGPELPSLVGALAGGLIFTFGLHTIARLRKTAEPSAALESRTEMSNLSALAPYLILILLVLITRIEPSIKAQLQALTLSWQWHGYSGSLAYAYHPGSLLLISFLLGGIIQRANPALMRQAVFSAAHRLLFVAAALFVMVLLSRFLLHLGAIDILGQQVAIITGVAWPFWSVWIGVLGTFITGSATSSNILFSEFQQSAAQASGNSALPLLGGQTYGAAMGNMICPHNIIAAGATVNIQGQEGHVMRYTLPMSLFLACLGGSLALVLT